ncbi:MAG: hypothetical protein ACE5KZ_00610 [Candidatus Scalinduaceae bacterium]
MVNAYSCKIKWPVDGKEIVIRIEPAYFDFLKIYWPNDFINLYTVHEVLIKPNRIFSGLNRPYSDSSNKLCVVGKPLYWYIGNTNNKVPFPSGFVYVVFLNERYSVYEFGAEKADTDDSLSPIGWRDRFGELIWKKNS